MTDSKTREMTSIGEKEENIMTKKGMTVFCAVLFTMLLITASDMKAATKTNAWNKSKLEVKTNGAFTFYAHPSKNGKEAWIYKIKIKGKKGRALSIPKTIQGKKVTRLGCPDRGTGDYDEAYTTLFGTYIEPWHDWDGGVTAVSTMKSIRIPDTVEVIDEAAFSGLNSVTTIKLPKKVKTIGRYTFYGCDKLKTIVLPEQMKSFDNSALWGCPSLKNIKLSKKNKAFQVQADCLIRKKDSALVFAAATGKDLAIPNGVKKLISYAFSSATSPVIHIPASVAQMEKDLFNLRSLRENIKIKDVTISEDNPVYARDGQCIYKKSDKSLAIAIPNEKGEVRISELVERLTPDISLVNCDTDTEERVEKLIYPSGLKHVTVPGFNAIRANNVYFTGSVPPKIVSPKSAAGSAELPVFCNVYVPEANQDAYKAWYKEYDCYNLVNEWHTYNPETGF